MSEDIKQAVEAVKDIHKAFDAFKQVDAERDAEIKRLGAALPETEAKMAKIEAALDVAQKKADEAVLAAKRQSRVVTDANGNEIDFEAKAAAWANEASLTTKRSAGEFSAKQMREYKDAFDRLLRANFNTDMLSDAERKALSVGQDTAGGYYVYPDLSGRVVQKVFETSPMRAYASVQVISTDALEGYYDNDETGFGWVAELESRPATTTPAIGKWRIPVHEMYAMPEASQQLLDDAIIPLETWLDTKIADRFSRAENAAFVSGNGVDKPRGFLTYANSTDLTVGIEQVKTGVNGAFAAAPNGGDVLIDALYGLKAQYRANATWFMNRATTKLVRKLKDDDGAYLWSPGVAAGQPATVLGYPIAAFEDMPDPATNSLSIAVGDMRQAYQIVDRLGIRMLRDPYTAKPKILFYATKRTGGALVNGEALKLIRFDNA
jgi:HK97 family phage major capsid protein